MDKIILIITFILTCTILKSQTISNVEYVSNINEYAVYINGKSKTNCYIGGRSKLVGIGTDFVLVEDNHIYFTYDCNCKTIASKEVANMGEVTVLGSTIKSKQMNGIYNYNKYWKSK